MNRIHWCVSQHMPLKTLFVCNRGGLSMIGRLVDSLSLSLERAEHGAHNLRSPEALSNLADVIGGKSPNPEP